MAAPFRILVVEDSEDDRYITSYVLKKRWPDLEILTAWNGEEAIEVLEACADRPPDLILLDINMPLMNGHEFLERWFGDRGQTTPTVVMLSSSDQHGDISRVRDYPAVRQYFVKPMRPEYLDAIDALVA